MTSNPKQNLLAPLLAVNFVGTLGYSLVIPFLAALVTKWGGGALVYSALIATYSLFQFFGAPLMGRWSDRVGRRRVLLFSQLGTLVSWLIFMIAFAMPSARSVEFSAADAGTIAGLSLSLPIIILFIARAVDGLTAGNVSVANAYLADISTDDTRTRNFGRMAVSSNLGFVVGPALGGVLVATIWEEFLPVVVAFLISLVALALIQFQLDDTRIKPVALNADNTTACDLYGHKPRKGYACQDDTETGWRAIVRLPSMGALLSFNFMIMAGFSFFYAAFPIHAVQNLTWSATQLGLYFAALSAVMVVAQSLILSFLAPRLGDRATAVMGCIVLGLGFLAMASAQNWIVYSSAVFVALGNGVMWPTFMAWLARNAGTEMQGEVQGLSTSLGSVASIIGLLGGGVLFVLIGPMVFFASAATVLCAAFLIGRFCAVVPRQSGADLT